MTAMSYHVASRIGGRVDPDVSLARAPWEGDIMAHDPRPETHPRLTLVKPNPRRSVTPEGFIAILRAECLNARAGA